MKKTLVLLGMIYFCISAAQTKAITDEGKEVVLFPDKTWRYVNESDALVVENTNTNPDLFVKAAKASFLLKSTRLDAGLYVDTKIWKFQSGSNIGPFVDYILINCASPSVMGFFSSETAPVQTLANLKDILLMTVEKRADYFRLVTSEYRTVNGLRVLYLEYMANLKGLDFTYIGNYYLTNEGYAAALGYTFTSNFDQHRGELTELINGIVSAKKGDSHVEVQPVKVYTNPPPPKTE